MAAGLEPAHYRAAHGTEPVDAFIEALPPEQQAAVDNQLARLELLDARRPHLPPPYGFSIDEELQALRCSTPAGA